MEERQAEGGEGEDGLREEDQPWQLTAKHSLRPLWVQATLMQGWGSESPSPRAAEWNERGH